MAYNYEYPYTDPNRYNSDWLLKKVKEIIDGLEEFKLINSIKYGGAWNITKQYSIYTLVDDNGNGYISIKNVPAGVQLDNSNYWVLVADFSALYAGVQTTLANVEKRVNRRYIIMADSYGAYPFDGTIYSWTAPVIEKLGIDAYNVSVGSRGFVYNPIVGTFLNGLQSLEVDSPETITDIFVCAGANDMSGIALEQCSASDIENAISTFISYAKTRFPNAVVSIGMIGNTAVNGYEKYYYDVLNAYRSCEKYGARYIANSECILMPKELISADGIHPTPAGFEELQRYMCEAILSGYCSIQRPVSSSNLTYYPTTTGEWNFQPEVQTMQNNSIFKVDMNKWNVGFQFSANNQTDLDNLSADATYNNFKLFALGELATGGVRGGDSVIDQKYLFAGYCQTRLMTTLGRVVFFQAPIYIARRTIFLGLPSLNASAEYMFPEGMSNNDLVFNMQIQPFTITVDCSNYDAI